MSEESDLQQRWLIDVFDRDVSGISTRLSDSPFGSVRARGLRAESSRNHLVDGSWVANNVAVENAGGIRSQGVATIEKSSVVENTSQTLSGGMAVGGEATIINSSVSGNRALVQSASTSPLGAGGIGVFQDTKLNIVRSIVSNNFTWGTAGGVGAFGDVSVVESTIDGNIAAGGAGGGIGSVGGQVLVDRSTISGNSTALQGGGIGSTSPVTMINSTVSGNRAALDGGGLRTTSLLSLNNVTITENIADSDGNGSGDGGGLASTLVQPSNSIIAGNIDSGGQAHDCSGRMESRGFNLIGRVSGCLVVGDVTGNVVGQSPVLRPLAQNGGRTMTHALLDGSPAIDTGSPGLGGFECESTDQRGIARPQDGNADGIRRCDIGSFERKL